ncbi:class I SAM-dependent methyltransferase [Caminibacter pacificus]
MLAKRYDSADMREFYEFIIPYLKGKTLLDIGCGSCRDVVFFTSLGFDVECVEPSIEFRKICSKKDSLIKIYNQKIPHIKLSKKYDVVILIGVWMHLRKFYYVKAIENLKSLLKRKGVLILSFSTKKRDGFDSINPKNLKFLFLKNGFRLLKENISNDSLDRKIDWVTQVYILDKIT